MFSSTYHNYQGNNINDYQFEMFNISRGWRFFVDIRKSRYYSSSTEACLLALLLPIPREVPDPASFTRRCRMGSVVSTAETTGGCGSTCADGPLADCLWGASVSNTVITMIFSSYSSRRFSMPAFFKINLNPSSSLTSFSVCVTGLSIHLLGAFIFHAVVL